jgi:dihydrofolate reductase
MISAIAAVTDNLALGWRDRKEFPWGRSKADLKRFRELTLEKTVIMGRKTYETLPKPSLEDCTLVVVSRTLMEEHEDRQYVFGNAPGLIIYRELAGAILTFGSMPGELMIAGGREIYEQMMPMLDRIYLSVFPLTCDGPDAVFFPKMGDDWELVTSHTHLGGPDDPTHLFNIYDRRK